MKTTIHSTTILKDKNIISKKTINKKKNDQVNTDFNKQYIYNIKVLSDARKIIKKQDIESDSIHIRPSNIDSSSINTEDTETGWFSVLDDQGYERFIRDGHVTINENREVAMDNYTALNNHDQPIVVPKNQKILIKAGGVIVIKEDIHKKGHEPVFLGQLKSTSLSDDDVIARHDSKMYDLNASGLEKYKKNDLKLKSKDMSRDMLIKNYKKTTTKLINAINIIRLIESDMAID
ncbi:Flagellar basal-body rod protein FlgF [Buchnera aphidicola (Cinara kochiana kochiana)]|uniref:Flagellar basal-body rod protein FlgF n=1 Tax=Buchnera aphidicola (Cinara kochiana kochiana) TaxID=2518976 RepID=A0A451D5Q0_9GAMM|nr:hypothetical protein [Buchnera aphidicola]VFP81132.1 Flagellar basal-body rod protein FlgF [Buchnera aphidicola (Cinara kochiana kochiana)]